MYQYHQNAKIKIESDQARPCLVMHWVQTVCQVNLQTTKQYRKPKLLYFNYNLSLCYRRTASIAGGHEYAAPRQASMSTYVDGGQVYRSIDYNGLYILHMPITG